MKEKPPGAPSGFNGHTAPSLPCLDRGSSWSLARFDTDRWPEGAGCSSLWALDARCEIPGSLDPRSGGNHHHGACQAGGRWLQIPGVVILNDQFPFSSASNMASSPAVTQLEGRARRP
jgi:hypothetical protein